MESNVNRTVYVKSQLMRITIKVTGKNWELSGTPANAPQQGDEVVETQLQLCRIYEQYGLYKVGIVDQVMGWIESKVGYAINSRRERTSWRRNGTFE